MIQDTLSEKKKGILYKENQSHFEDDKLGCYFSSICIFGKGNVF